MGNRTASNGGDQSAVEIVQRKAEVEFEQEAFIREIEGSIEDEYQVLSPCLEQNQFYELRKAIHSKTRLIRAVYIVNKYKIRSHERELFETQIRRLKKVDHPAVPKIYELFKNDHRFFVVTESKRGESLAQVLEEQHYFEQSAAAGVAWQLLALLSHCHKRGITHTDLKLTSICYNSKRQDVLKVMDFSISKIFRVEEVVDQSIGRAVLSAPETVSGQTSSKSDIWSTGIILYILLCGEPPIIANTRSRLIHKFRSFLLRFRERRFRHVSEEAKEMVRRMLRINPNQRPSADQLLESGWFVKHMRLPQLPQHSLRRCLKELYFFSASSKLQEATWTFFVNSLISHDEKSLITAIFLRLDKASKGELDHSDLKEGFLELLGDQEKAEACAGRILGRLRKNRIVFSEFVTYCANRFFLIREVNLIKIFQVFDEDGSGEIEVGELRDTLGNSKEVRQEVWVQLVQEANANAGAKLSLEQFSDMIRQLNYADRESDLDQDNIFTW